MPSFLLESMRSRVMSASPTQGFVHMPFKKILLATVFAAPFVANAAYAADLPSRTAPPAPAPVYAPPPVFTWTGFYLGLNGGGSFSNSNVAGVPGGAFAGNPAAGVYGAR